MSDKENLLEIFHTLPWCQQLPDNHLYLLVGLSRVVQFPKGAEIFKEGEPEDYLYIVINGRVAIEIFVPGQGRISIYTAEPTEVVGWSSVTPVVLKRTASARAVLDSRLIAMDAPALRRLCESDCGLGCTIFRHIANVAAQRLLMTRLQLLDIFRHPVEQKTHATDHPNAQ